MQEAIAAKQAKLFERLEQADKDAQRADPEMIRQLADLNDKASVERLLQDKNSEEGQKFRKEIVDRLKKIQEKDRQQGDFTVQTLIDRFNKNSPALPQGSNPNDPFAAPNWAGDDMLQPF